MFYRHKWLCKQGKLFEPWVAASYHGNFLLPYTEILGKVDIQSVCGNLEEVILSNSHNINHRISLRLSIKLIYGVCLLFEKQLKELYDNCFETYFKVSTTRSIEDILNMSSSESVCTTDDGGRDENNEGGSSAMEKEFYNADEPAVGRGFSAQPGCSRDYNIVNPSQKRSFSDEFIGIKSLRQNIRRSSSNKASNESSSAAMKTAPRKRKRRKHQYRRMPTARVKKTKTKVSNIDNDNNDEYNQHLPSPDTVRRRSPNDDTSMSFSFRWHDDPANDFVHSTPIVKSLDNEGLHRMSRQKSLKRLHREENKCLTNPVLTPMGTASDTDMDLGHIFKQQNSADHVCESHQSFHLLHPKNMDVSSLKLFTGPISNYDDLRQTNVDYSSYEPWKTLLTRRGLKRDEFSESGVLFKLQVLWQRNSIVTINDILNMGKGIFHTKMAIGQIFASLMSLKKHQYVVIINNGEGKIENITKGCNFQTKSFKYHPYFM